MGDLLIGDHIPFQDTCQEVFMEKDEIIKGVLGSVFNEEIDSEEADEHTPRWASRWIDYKKGNLPLGRYFPYNNLLIICNVSDEEFDYVKNAFSICEIKVNVKRRTNSGYIS